MNTATVKLYVDTRRRLRLLAALLEKSMQDAADEAIGKALEDAQRTQTVKAQGEGDK